MAPSLISHSRKESWREELGRIESPRSIPRAKSTANANKLATVAIDFGTTFSAIAYACFLDHELYHRDDLILAPVNVKAQQKYLDGNGNAFKKRDEVPSVLAYDPKTGQAYFGLEVETALEQGKIQERDKLELLKLLIARRSLIADETRTSLNQKINRVRRRDPCTGRLGKFGPSIVELISDCLRALWRNALWNLGQIHTDDAVNSWEIRLILCIPAIWEIREESVMRHAARLAGIPNPEFVSEPEGAAGLYFAEEPDPIDESFSVQSHFLAV